MINLDSFRMYIYILALSYVNHMPFSAFVMVGFLYYGKILENGTDKRTLKVLKVWTQLV